MAELDRGKEAVDETRESVALLTSAFDTLSLSIREAFDDAIEGASNLDDQTKRVAKNWAKDIGRSVKKISIDMESQVSIMGKIRKGQDITKDLEKEREKILDRYEAIKIKILALEHEDIEMSDEKRELIEQQKLGLEEQYKHALKQIKDNETRNKQQNESLGITGKLLKGFDGILNTIDKTGSLSSTLDISGALKETKHWANNSEKIPNSFSKAGKFLGKIGTNLINNIKPLDILGLLATQLLSAFKQSDKIVGDMAKNLNMSYSEALGVKQEMTSIANSSNSIFVTSKGISKSFSFIQEQLGISAQTLDNEILTSMTKFREISGMSNETLKGTSDLIIGTNQSLEDATGEIIAQAEITGLKNGVLLNGKKIQEEVSQLSAATTLSLGKQPGELAKAVATAKSLGLEMAKLEGIAGSLLDFESSIENELQAELMLGKNISLEKARQAALDNDMATLSEEIAKNVGDSAEFSKMNRLQQNALAGSLGMNREELAKTLYTQEQLAEYSGDDLDRKQRVLDALIEENSLEEAKEIMKKKSIEDLEKQASIQDRFNQSVEKLKEVFVNIAEITMPIFDGMASFVSLLASSKEMIAALTGALTGVAIVYGVIAAKAAITALSALTTASAMTLGLGVVGVIGGITAGIAAYNSMVSDTESKAKQVGDVFSPSKGKTQISTKEGDLLELSENDDLIAAPNITKNVNKNFSTENVINKDVTQKETTYINDNKETNQLLRQILNKQAKVQMDSTDIGTAFAINSFEIQ